MVNAAVLASTLCLLAACSASSTTQAPTTKAATTPPAAAPPGSAAAATAGGSTPPAALAAPAFRHCGELACKAFPSAQAAFDHVLTEQPRVLAIGEAHAQQSGPQSRSTTRRFMEDLLPRLAPRASDLVIELWVASGSCGKVERQVAGQQQAVTAPQAATNQSEFLELGHHAKALSIQPQALIPTCEQYQAIAGAGPSDIEAMLTMLKSVTERDVAALVARRPPERLIVAYGGAMHNDLAPRPGREDFAFGPELARLTGERYVELDLIVPEQIRDTEAWRGLPWYAQYSHKKAGSEAILLSWAPHAYALIFPQAEAAP
ncbi:MAG TPA: hypothetical protein VIW29_20745 [Polyangiaceae bacterium]